MEKEEIILEVKQASSVLAPGEIEPFFIEIVKETDDNYVSMFERNRKNMMKGIISKLRQMDEQQSEEFLFRMKKAAETRLARKRELLEELSSLEMSTVETDVPAFDEDAIWEPLLLRTFIDRFGCLANNVDFFNDQYDPDEDEFDSEEKEWTSECIGVSGPLASACARMFQSTYSTVKAICDKYEEKLRAGGHSEKDTKELSDAYGYGICDGIKYAMREHSFEERDVGLHLITLQAIQDYKDFMTEEIEIWNVLNNHYPPPRLNPIYTKGFELGRAYIRSG